jgi:hypothetical protein
MRARHSTIHSRRGTITSVNIAEREKRRGTLADHTALRSED